MIIVGAGAAGLAAANVLADAGRDVLIVEARTRIGGRIFTDSSSNLSVPIELGAEFIHGVADPIRVIAAANGLRTVDIAGQRYEHTGARLTTRRGSWARIERVMRRLDPDRDPDRSFAEALRANRGSLVASDRAMATRFVEGFDAADTTRVSERWLAESNPPSDDERAMRIGRLLDGYGSLIDALARPVRAHIRLGTVVSVVQWTRGRVEVECRAAGGGRVRRYAARAVLLTVPLGVLQAPAGAVGAIVFDPPVPALRRAASLGVMGAAARVVLRFAEPFWLEARFAQRLGAPALDQMSFLQSRRPLPFAVWWSSYPVRAPVLVAWSGGPRAARLARRPAAGLVAAAVQSLAMIFATTPARIRRPLRASYYHDWVGDPFSRGAYSYARVGGDHVSARLAAPVQHTIWYAGEAATPASTTGTVHGAIASGQRAARAILRD